MRVWLLALLIATAGCLGAADTNPKNDPRPPMEEDEDPAVPIPGPGRDDGVAMLLEGFSFAACNGLEAHVLVDGAAATALLPENFTARTDQGPASEALLRYRFLSCPTFNSATTLVNDTVYGDVSVLIDDPDIHASGASQWYRLQIFSRDDVLASAWEFSGYSVTTGDITLAAGPGLETMAFAGYSAQWVGNMPASVAGSGASFTTTGLGLLVWSETVETALVESGLGTLTIPSSDPASGIIPDDPTKFTLIAHRDTNVSDGELVRVTG